MALKSGVTADIKIRVYENKKAIVLPRNLIAEDAAGKYVFIANNGKAQKQYISTGLESDLDVEIIKGLEAESKVIFKGASGLTPGVKVKVVQ
jgi:hypothetical protein